MRTTTEVARELLEPGEAAYAALQRHPESPLPPLPERVRMALQLPPRQQPVEHAGMRNWAKV